MVYVTALQYRTRPCSYRLIPFHRLPPSPSHSGVQRSSSRLHPTSGGCTWWHRQLTIGRALHLGAHQPASHHACDMRVRCLCNLREVISCGLQWLAVEWLAFCYSPCGEPSFACALFLFKRSRTSSNRRSAMLFGWPPRFKTFTSLLRASAILFCSNPAMQAQARRSP